MLDPSTYNTFASTGQDSADLRKRPILRSGGFTKNSSGMEFDLGLKSLRLTSIIGNSSTNPSNNVFGIEMQIVEPYGVNFLAQLAAMASQIGTSTDHFQLPYLIEIKWNGYDDNGQLVSNIASTGPKLITTQIVNISFNITSAGTVYTLSLIGFNEQAINRYYGVVRHNAELYGSSLQDFLTGNRSLKTILDSMGREDYAEKRCQYPDIYDFKVVSFDSTHTTDDGKLANEKVTFPLSDGGETTPFFDRAMDRNETGITLYKISANSNVKDIIVDIAKKSKYFQNKITDTPNSDTTNPLELIKIVPVITELQSFDTIRGVYQKKITYMVMPYYVYGQVYPHAGQAPVSSRGFMKEYNWLFTGKNKDVLDLNLNYNLMYFRTFERASSEKGLAQSGANIEIIAPENTVITQVQKDKGGVNILQTGGETSRSKNTGFKPNAVQEIFDQLLNSPQNEDLTTLDISIIGDPDWVLQDRSVRPVGVGIMSSVTGLVDDDFSKGIASDVNEVYVKINFKTPRDYSDTTGLMQFTSDQSLISGVYGVVSIDSVFEEGSFTQTLHTYRVHQQLENIPSGSAAASAASTTSTAVTINNSTTTTPEG